MTRASSGARERELAAPAREESGAERAVRGVAELGIPGDDGDGLLPRLLEDPGIAEEVGRAELRQPRLSRAEELARTPELQVHLGDLEPVAGRRHRADASLRLLGEAAAREKDAVRLPRAATDALGTSMPTSITVVQTRRWISPALNRRIVATCSRLPSRHQRRPYASS